MRISGFSPPPSRIEYRHPRLIRRERQAAELNRSGVRDFVQVEERFDRLPCRPVEDLHRRQFFSWKDATGARQIASADPQAVVKGGKHKSLTCVRGARHRLSQWIPAGPGTDVVARSIVLCLLPLGGFIAGGFKPLIRILERDPANGVALRAQSRPRQLQFHTNPPRAPSAAELTARYASPRNRAG